MSEERDERQRAGHSVSDQGEEQPETVQSMSEERDERQRAGHSVSNSFSGQSAGAEEGTKEAFIRAAISSRDKHQLFRIIGMIQGRAVRVLIDSGASHDFISSRLVELLGLPTTQDGTIRVRFADGNHTTGPLLTVMTELFVGAYHTDRCWLMAPLVGFDVILGAPWHHDVEPAFQWKRGLVNVHVGDTCHTLSAVSEYPDGPYGVLTTSAAECTTGDVLTVLVQPPFDDEDGSTHRPEPSVTLGPCCDQEMARLVEEYVELFPRELPMKLPPDRGHSHAIDLIAGSEPPPARVFRHTRAELDELDKQIHHLLDVGYIRPSISPYGAPVFFVKKPDGSLRLVCDWRGLNRITIKDRTLLPNIEDLHNRLLKARCFSQFDLHSGYNQVLIRPSDVHKTAIRTSLGSFEWVVMGLGLTNAPATFQTMMRDIFGDLIDRTVIVYLDDILVFSETAREHAAHLVEVFRRLRSHQLYCKPSKCFVGMDKVLFLGSIISFGMIAPDPKKIQDIVARSPPTGVRDVRIFVGMCNFFNKHIRAFSEYIGPLTELTHKFARFAWTEEHQLAFERLKSALTTAPVLAIADFAKPFLVVTDASDVALGAVLLQVGDDGLRHVIAYRSKLLSPRERAWATHDRETFAIVDAVIHWRHYLDGRHFIVETDHQSLRYLQTQVSLSKKQIRWLELLANFDFEILYKPGKQNVVADCLSRPAGLFMISVTTQSAD